TGVSKGKGYQGVVKRHHFSGSNATHGAHEYFRHGGSIGNRTHPGRVFKNKRMSGHMGDERVTTQNLAVVAVRPDDNVLLVRAAVPRSLGGRKAPAALVRAAYAPRSGSAGRPSSDHCPAITPTACPSKRAVGRCAWRCRPRSVTSGC